jgi:Skp family chaperone for outer membrane proteins
MSNKPDESVLYCELSEYEYAIKMLENNNLEYLAKIEENSKEIEELKKKLKEKEAMLKKLLEEKEVETKIKFEQAQEQAEKYSDWSYLAASARLKSETKLIQGLIYEVDSEGQTDKLPPKKSKWEF